MFWRSPISTKFQHFHLWALKCRKCFMGRVFFFFCIRTLGEGWRSKTLEQSFLHHRIHRNNVLKVTYFGANVLTGRNFQSQIILQFLIHIHNTAWSLWLQIKLSISGLILRPYNLSLQYIRREHRWVGFFYASIYKN